MIAASSVNLREYSRIHTGTNQELGYETPFFGYTTNDIQIALKTDGTTYFHYPHTAPSGLLIDSKLATNGAIAGKAPFYSDKIWKKMANYTSTSIWGDSQPEGKQTGVWLCSWLSGNVTNSTWMDRWYNPGYIDSNDAFIVTTPLSSVVKDIVSEMSFEPDSYYKYFHVGDTYNNMIVDTLSGENNLKLNIENWTQNPVDLSIYNNTSRIENFDNGNISNESANKQYNTNDDSLILNGSNYCVTIHTSAIAMTNDYTFNIWAQSDDWTKGNNTILSKNNRGGYNLKVDQGFNTPFMVFCDDVGKLLIMNNNGDAIISKTLPQPSKPTSLAIDEYNFTWVADNSAKKVYKIDYNGDILDQITFDSTVDLQYITLDSNNLWCLNSTTNIISSFDLFTAKLSTEFVTTYTALSVVDNDNNIWTTITGLVYKNGIQVVSGNYIACDKDNYIWVIFDSNKYQKIYAPTTIMSMSGSFDDAISIVNFSYELNNGDWTDFAYFTQTNNPKIYKTDINGKIIKTIDLTRYDLIPKLSTFTSYDWNRRYNYLIHNKEPYFKTDLFINNSPTIIKKTATIPVSGFNNTNWHMFTVTRKDSTLNLYIDSVLQDTVDVTNEDIYYHYENTLVLGGDSGKIETLRKELSYKNDYFKGYVDSLRIYDYALDIFDINSIYFTKYKFTDLIWNIPTGIQNYIEEIVRFFKFKTSGQKSLYYNINLIGLNIQDEGVRNTIEGIIKNTIKKVTPAYTELYKIIWK